MHVLKLRKVGNSVGVILPKDLLDSLHVGEGDRIVVTDDAGGARITPYDPDFTDAMTAFEATRRKYRNALRELGK